MYVLCAIVSLDLTTALYRYFKPADNVLPSPTGDLLASVSLSMIEGYGPKLALALNTKIKTMKISSREETGFSRKFGPMEISRYMVMGYRDGTFRWMGHLWLKWVDFDLHAIVLNALTAEMTYPHCPVTHTKLLSQEIIGQIQKYHLLSGVGCYLWKNYRDF